MELISFPRMGVDGVLYTQKDIEQAYITNLPQEIRDALDKISPKNGREKKVIDFLKRQIAYLLTAKPKSLERFKKWSDKVCLFGNDTNPRTDNFKDEILTAFGYEDYRKKHLVKHAVRINVKTCCYCNMNYTLLIEEKKARSINLKALLQFDHFYDKKLYPHLSMSMYNLIPSCATCNQGKQRKGDLPIWFNPYHASIMQLYKFKVKDPLQLYLAVVHPGKIEVECVPQSSEDITACDDWFHLSAKYSIHKDIVQEIFDKAHQYPYYAYLNNFCFLDQDKNYPLRMLLGVYTDDERLSKRPMSKFITDLWEQACVYAGNMPKLP